MMAKTSLTIRGSLLFALLLVPAVVAVRDSDFAHLDARKDLDTEIGEETDLNSDPASKADLIDGHTLDNILKVKSSAGREVKVSLLMTRQGFDCQHATYNFASGHISKATSTSMADPGLTDCGWHQAKKAGEAIKAKGITPDIVLTSSMMTAMETALAMYPGQTVMPVPYIANGGTVHALDEQQKVMQAAAFKERAQLQSLPLDLKWMNMPGFGPARDQNMAGNFLGFMAHNFLPLLPPELQAKDFLTIAVITHWETIEKAMDALCSRKDIMKHTEVVDLGFIYKGYAVAASADGSIVKAEQVTPYISSSAEAWAALKKVPDEDVLKTNLLPKLGNPNIIVQGAWPTDSFALGVNRVLQAAEASCEVRFGGFDSPEAELCERDFGKTCVAELDTFGSMTRPDVALVPGAQGQCCVDL